MPLEFGLSGMRNLEAIRSISLFGLSDVKCYFTWDSDYYWDRSDTINQLAFITLAQSITPIISPENPIGEIYHYIVQSPDHDLLKEKEIEDWVLEKQLKTVPGVIDVAGFGGLTKEYHVDVDPDKLVHYQISLPALTSAVQNSNTNAGGNYLTVGSQASDVRGIGLIRSLDDIGRTVLSVNQSTPIRVRDVADVDIGYAPRLGAVGINGRTEAVEGIVLMRKYGDTLRTLKGGKGRRAQYLGSTTQRLPGRALLRPYWAGEAHSAHGTDESQYRHGPGLPRTDFFLGKSARGDYRSDQYSTGPLRRIHADASE
jgi:cobalt-zinc-cadmium resistance protein CzcA